MKQRADSGRAISIEGVSFEYRDGATVLEDVDVRLTGRWTGLVGENGSGKTTLLRLLAREL